MCRGVQQNMMAGLYAVTLTVKHPYAGYAKGTQIRLKCSAKVTRDKVVETIRNFQRYGPWLEQQWHSPENMEKMAQAQSRKGSPLLGLVFSNYGAKYASAAKVTLEETVIPRGCRHTDAKMMFDIIHDNRVKDRNDHALQDVEQTCDAFKAHFDRKANRTECIQHFAFCLSFYTTMRNALLAVGRRTYRDRYEAAEERLSNVLKFLKRMLLGCADQRAALQKAIAECDIEFCQQMLVSQHMRKIVIPLSDLQATNKAAKLSNLPHWDMLFTMILLESTVFLRLQEIQALGPHGQPVELTTETIAQRMTPFRNTNSTEVPADQLGDAVARAASDGCFDVIPFCLETFTYIVVEIYDFPRVVRPGLAGSHNQTMDVAAFFKLATKCSVSTPAMFGAIRQDLLRNSQHHRPGFAVPFLLELDHVLREDTEDFSAVHQEQKCQLFISYFEGFNRQFPHGSFLNDSIYRLYSPLLEHGELRPLMTSLFEVIMRRVQAEPPHIVHLTSALSEQLNSDHPLKRDQLMQHIVLAFLASRPAVGTIPRSAEHRLEQYKRSILKIFELLQHSWTLDFGGKGEMIVNKVASDVAKLGSTHAAYGYGGEGGERLAVICEVIKDPNFRALVHSTTAAQARGQLDGSLDVVVDRLTLQSVFGKTVLTKILGELAPDDECFNLLPVVPTPAYPATYDVWLRICEQIGRNVSNQAPADRIASLRSLSDSGHQQMSTASRSGQVKQLACIIFYSTVLLGPILSAATFSEEDNPVWKNLIRIEHFPLISRAIEIFRQGLSHCEHPLAIQHLTPVMHVEAAVAGLRSAFETKDLSKGELIQLNEILRVDAAAGSVLGEQFQQKQINLVLIDVDNDLTKLRKAKQVVQFLGTLNVERGRDEQDIARVIAESEQCPIGEISSKADVFTKRYETGDDSLSEKLYGLVVHFQNNASVIFNATVETLRKSEGIGPGYPCDLDRAKEFMDQVDQQLRELLERKITVDKLRPILPALQNWYALPCFLAVCMLACMS